jgi:hypothetical protein
MDTHDLFSAIDKNVTKSAHLVLLAAIESVGECTYARYLPSYARAKINISRLMSDRIRDYDYEFKHGAMRHNFQQRFNTLYREMVTHHRNMYRQPCLVCEYCQHRRKSWQSAAYSPHGDALSRTSQREENVLSRRDRLRLSELRMAAGLISSLTHGAEHGR